MRFCGVSSKIAKLFVVVGLDKVLDCYSSEEQAVASFSQDQKIARIVKQKLRRHFKRIPLRGDIEYKQKVSSVTYYNKGKILNLSALGIFIVGKQLFPVGDVLSLRINLSDQLVDFEIDARVAWIVDKEVGLLESWGMGLEFFNISNSQQKQIMQFVDKHLANIDFDSF